MRTEYKRFCTCFLLLAGMLFQTISLGAQTSGQQVTIERTTGQAALRRLYKTMLTAASGSADHAVFEKLFGSEADAAIDAFQANTEDLWAGVTTAAGNLAAERLEQ